MDNKLYKATASRIPVMMAVAVILVLLGLTTGTAIAEPDSRDRSENDLTSEARPRQGPLLVVLPKMSCEALAFEDFTSLPDAGTQILSSELVPADGSTPEYCKVTGYVEPQIQFELRLPTKTWTQRYLQLGCGGFCGLMDIDWKLETERQLGECVPHTINEVVVGSSNSGHVGNGTLWAVDAPQLKVDWGYRSEHVFAIASRAIINAFYGQEPQYAYFGGCSNGGRQALMLAQRYPDDFDGILAGGAVNALTGVVMALAWTSIANTAADGSPILTLDKLPVIHQAALAECDGRDGLVDGQITDPRACQFDPASLQCPAGQDAPDCLTPAQVEAVREIYAGPVDDQGHRLYPGGLAVGSELEWRLALFGWNPPFTPGVSELLSRDYLRGMAAWDEQLSYDNLSFDLITFQRLSHMGPIYDATDPDLRPFRDSGGKLIIWHGWEDSLVPPIGTIAYYQAVQDAVGGLEETRQFTRLYMFPGASHCSGGTGPSEFDLLTPLMEWVEQGIAPEGVIARDRQDGQVVRTRPVYPYPLVATYDGSGSIDDASNFVAAMPTARHDDRIEWAGEYRSGYQQWCEWQGTQLVCTRNEDR
jgi:pimeloyl-ACP methyl ester carboxylesterase